MAVRITRAGVGLTIGVIILGLAVLGGLYLVKQRGEEARRDQAIQIAQQNLESQSSDNGATSPNNSSNSSNGSTSTDNSSNSSNSGSQSTNTSNGSTSTTGSGATNSTPTSELPQTGPADEWGAMIAVAVLTFSIGAYLTSRRHVRGSRSLGV